MQLNDGKLCIIILENFDILYFEGDNNASILYHRHVAGLPLGGKGGLYGSKSVER